jgi:hypothetical protein
MSLFYFYLASILVTFVLFSIEGVRNSDTYRDILTNFFIDLVIAVTPIINIIFAFCLIFKWIGNKLDILLDKKLPWR